MTTPFRIFCLAVILVAGCGDDGNGSNDAGAEPNCTNCESSCDADGCIATCPPGEDCTVGCAATPSCEIGCGSGNTCNATCEGLTSCPIDCTGVNNCEVTCRSGAACSIDCTGGNNCDEVVCATGAACTMNCMGANNCSFSMCDDPDGQVDCGGNVIVCGAPCPA